MEKAAGVLIGMLATFIYFRVIGTMPIMQTLVGLLLGLACGVLGWLVLERWVRSRKDVR